MQLQTSGRLGTADGICRIFRDTQPETQQNNEIVDEAAVLSALCPPSFWYKWEDVIMQYRNILKANKKTQDSRKPVLQQTLQSKNQVIRNATLLLVSHHTTSLQSNWLVFLPIQKLSCSSLDTATQITQINCHCPRHFLLPHASYPESLPLHTVQVQC